MSTVSGSMTCLFSIFRGLLRTESCRNCEFLISGAYILPGYPRCYHIEADLMDIPVGFSATTLHKFLNETGFGNELLQKTPTYLKPYSE